jgi:hypothetical protein
MLTLMIVRRVRNVADNFVEPGRTEYPSGTIKFYRVRILTQYVVIHDVRNCRRYAMLHPGARA